MLEGVRIGCCLEPHDMSSIPLLRSSARRVAPKAIDHRDYMTPTECQGDRPWCAAYAAANWAEAMVMKRRHAYEQIGPEWIYGYAKTVDGMPDVEGTTLTAALEALRGSVFDRDGCFVKIVGRSRDLVRFAVHEFDAITAGFDISEEWLGCRARDPFIRDPDSPQIGGHAVVICGYDETGVMIQNSWGSDGFGEYGFATVSWDCFDRQYVYGAVLSSALNKITLMETV